MCNEVPLRQKGRFPLQYIPDDDIAGFIETCKVNNLDKVDGFVQELIFNGFGAGQLFGQLQEVILDSDLITDAQKAAIIDRLAVADHRLMDGADEYLQMMDVGAVIMNALSSLSHWTTLIQPDERIFAFFSAIFIPQIFGGIFLFLREDIKTISHQNLEEKKSDNFLGFISRIRTGHVL